MCVCARGTDGGDSHVDFTGPQTGTSDNFSAQPISHWRLYWARLKQIYIFTAGGLFSFSFALPSPDGSGWLKI